MYLGQSGHQGRLKTSVFNSKETLPCGLHVIPNTVTRELAGGDPEGRGSHSDTQLAASLLCNSSDVGSSPVRQPVDSGLEASFSDSAPGEFGMYYKRSRHGGIASTWNIYDGIGIALHMYVSISIGIISGYHIPASC